MQIARLTIGRISGKTTLSEQPSISTPKAKVASGALFLLKKDFVYLVKTTTSGPFACV